MHAENEITTLLLWHYKLNLLTCIFGKIFNISGSKLPPITLMEHSTVNLISGINYNMRGGNIILGI